MKTNIFGLTTALMILGSLSMSAHASDPKWIETEIKHSKLSTLQSQIFDFRKHSVLGTCGLIIQGKALKTPQYWDLLLKRVIEAKDLDQINIHQNPVTETSVKEATKALFSQDFDLTPQKESALNSLESLIWYSLSHDKMIQFFDGSIEGNFVMSMSFIAFVDPTRQEFLIFGEGSCE